ncbi:triacylglycerol lipase 2-like [Syzygium oleosum]|uniref:triacylglycerol lipase 2-like n=1 Tax=Syzygium oleosum TaxID=219896 RepID=UPI0011D2A357|nr:triacylglycerol lipase 2-like [Syzygium oleosum]
MGHLDIENKQLAMANTKVQLILATFLFCVASVAAGRARLYSTRSSAATDGICKSLVVTQGYACQEHTVTTKDGYILGLQRIPASRSGRLAYKPPVLLQHGLMMDAVTWLMNLPDESLAFILADAGFDVWLSNSRGTTSSLQHTSLSPSDPAYWEWSWDELVAHDMPAVLQHVRRLTGQNMHYVGHSLGTLIALAAFSHKELVNMLRSAVLLSPIAYMNQMPSPLARSAAQIFLAEDVYWLGLHQFIPKGDAVNNLIQAICNIPGNDCSNLMSGFTGQNCCLNSSRSDIFLAHEPQSTATKNMIHLAQMIRTGTIEMFDYGNEDDNMNHYGQPTPPVYNMTSIPNDLPLYLSYGGKDLLADPDDVKVLLGCLKDHDGDKLVIQYREDYAHADFVFGVNANQVIYEPVMAFFRLH